MWLVADYLPEVAELDRRIFPPPPTLAGWLGGRCRRPSVFRSRATRPTGCSDRSGRTPSACSTPRRAPRPPASRGCPRRWSIASSLPCERDLEDGTWDATPRPSARARRVRRRAASGRRALTDEGGERVDRRPSNAHLEVQVRPRRVARRADEPDLAPRLHDLAHADVHPREVRVEGARGAVVDRHEEPPAAGEEARVRDAARGGRDDGRSRGRGDVDSAVKPVSPGAEPVRRARLRQEARARSGRAAAAGGARQAWPRPRRRPARGRRSAGSGRALPPCALRRRRRSSRRGTRARRARTGSARTSVPRVPVASGRDPSVRRARTRRVCGPTTPSTAIRARACAARTAAWVAGPVTPSIAPSYSPRERSVAWSAAVAGSPAACAGTTPKTNGSAASRTFARMKRRFAAAAWIPRPPPLTRFEPCDGPSLTLARAAAAAGSETGRGTVAFYFGTFLQASAAWWCCSFSAARWA